MVQVLETFAQSSLWKTDQKFQIEALNEPSVFMTSLCKVKSAFPVTKLFAK